MPSRQERRRAERDAAKHAPAKSGAAAALVNPLGDWTTQNENPGLLFGALGADVMKQMAAAGDAEAQWSQGVWLVGGGEASGGAAHAEAGLAPCILCPEMFQFPTREVDIKM